MPRKKKEPVETFYECQLFGKGVGRNDIKEILNVRAESFSEAEVKAIDKAYDLYPPYYYEWSCISVRRGALVQPILPGFEQSEKPGSSDNDGLKVA
jgi:hypothetical protein